MAVIRELAGMRRQRRAATPSRRKKGDRLAYLFLAPWLIGLIGVTLLPILASFLLSFTDYNLLSDPDFVGFDNYAKMLDDPSLAASLQVTLTYVAISIPLILAFALGIAVLLDRGMRGLSFYRSVYYLPSLLGASVAVAVLWRALFGVDGLVNEALGVVGIEGKGWISDPSTALGTLVILNVWTFGSPMVIFLAGLRQIPASLLEAASLDGAGPVRRFFSISLPLLSPLIFFNLVLQTIQGLQSFTQAYVISGGSGGPVDSTLLIGLYLYKAAFTNFTMGYASALAWLVLLITAVVTALAFWSSRYWVFYSEDAN